MKEVVSSRKDAPDFIKKKTKREWMGIEIKKPWSIDEIRKYPIAVLCAFLIAIIITLLARNAYLSYRVDELRDQSDEEKNKRIQMYEQMIFYKSEKERLEHEANQSDSTVRSKTEPYVQKILKYE